jgi:flavin-dependent dehydrogenase
MARPELSVWLADAGKDGPSVGESIPPDSSALLKRLGVLDRFLSDGHQRCLGSASAWGSSTLGYNDFVLNPHGTGWHLDRPLFDAMMRERAQMCGARLLSGRSVRGAEQLAGRTVIAVQNGAGQRQALSARFVVDATGSSAVLARLLGARHRWHDRLVLASAFFQAAPGNAGSQLSLLEAAPIGWWYCAGLPGERIIVTLASDPGQLRSHQAARWPAWVAALAATQHVAPRLAGSSLQSGRLATLRASSRRLDRIAGAGWLAVGDAAASCDPLAAQGIYQSLQGGLAARTAVCDQLDTGAMPTGYAAAVAAEFAQYLDNHRYLYSLENRFEAAPFWQRRHSATLAA